MNSHDEQRSDYGNQTMKRRWSHGKVYSRLGKLGIIRLAQLGAIVWLLATAMPASAEVIVARLQPLTPTEFTAITGRVYDGPIRYRLVRADNDAPLVGVQIYLSIGILECLPLLECDVPPPEWYGSWVGSPEPYTAALVTDANGEVTAPGLLGGTTPMWYSIHVSVYSAESPYYELVGGTASLIVNQIAPPTRPPHAIPAMQTPGLVLGLLAIAAAACLRFRAR